MPILTTSGRIVIAEAIAARALHLAWGAGDGAWLTPPPENAAATALQSEFGRRIPTVVGYVEPDVAGEIVLPSGSFTASASPTKHLYVKVNFDFTDAPSSVVREIGLFSNTTIVGGLPPGQQYFSPAEIVTPGRLLHLENIAPIFRSPAIRESFEIVITF